MRKNQIESLQHSKCRSVAKAKVPKGPQVTTRSANNDGTHSQRREGEDSPASSVISREDVALVVDEVLKTLRHRDATPSGPNRTGGTPSAEANGKTEGTSSRSEDIENLHFPG